MLQDYLQFPQGYGLWLVFLGTILIGWYGTVFYNVFFTHSQRCPDPYHVRLAESGCFWRSEGLTVQKLWQSCTEYMVCL
jgi:hypothetical protein